MDSHQAWTPPLVESATLVVERVNVSPTTRLPPRTTAPAARAPSQLLDLEMVQTTLNPDGPFVPLPQAPVVDSMVSSPWLPKSEATKPALTRWAISGA